MGHIKEPSGVDLVINSRPLTKEDETSISEYIATYKSKHSYKKQLQPKRTPRKTTSKKNLEV